MLARHLLFLATRRPNNALLPISGEGVPVATQAPPPYVGPPQPGDWPKISRRVDFAEDSRNPQKTNESRDKSQDYRIYDEKNRTNYEKMNNRYPANICSADNRCDTSTMYDNTNQLCYGDNRVIYSRDIVNAENAINQQFYGPRGDVKQQFFTLPTRRPTRDAEPPRSVTPDITRGLGRGPLSTMHMLARHGRKPVAHNSTGQIDNYADSNRRSNVEQIQMQGRSRLVENLQPQKQTIDARNRFVTPLGLSALGYRFFASSPVQETDRKSTEIVRHPAISPIATGNAGNAFKLPTARSNPTVAERLTQIGNNCTSPIPGGSGRSTPTQTSSGRNTPTNLSIISPTRSTMSNEELFAAIHKSKRRLNIKDDAESLSPASSTGSLVKAQAGTRHSWSPESQKTPEIPPTIQSPSATSRLDFKRLLLQQSVKIGPTRLSAAEQLKLSRQQCSQQLQHHQQPPQHYHHHHHHHHHQQQQQQQQYHQQYQQSVQQNVAPVPLAKVLSPRSVWRFQTPRTDVLSSTIIEDSAAEEKAMKPSPENPVATSRPTSRRQLDLSEKTPERLARNEAYNEQTRCSDQGRVSRGAATSVGTRESESLPTVDKAVSAPSVQSNARVSQASSVESQSIKATPKLPQSKYVMVTSKILPQNPNPSAATSFETRRLNNQLARAQFLAGVPAVNSNNNINNNNNNNQRQSAYFEKRFRARSESPKPAAAQSVARSPSAPTLETAL